MPRRRRAREFQRRLNRAVAQVEAKELPPLPPDPLDDYYWRAYETDGWCCPSCDRNHPLTIQAAAREEIDMHLKGAT